MRRRTYRNAERHGRRAEFLSAWLLRLKGFRIIARHWKCSSGEIDIIARRGRLLVFVEVKARGNAGSAAEIAEPQAAGTDRPCGQPIPGRQCSAGEPGSALRHHAGRAVAPTAACSRGMVAAVMSADLATIGVYLGPSPCLRSVIL